MGKRSRDWRKYGSPYDPQYKGKQMRKRDKSQEERHREQFQVGGCGDPACGWCNPETASQIGNAGRKSPLQTVRDYVASYRDVFEAYVPPGDYVGNTVSSEATVTANPDGSYTISQTNDGRVYRFDLSREDIKMNGGDPMEVIRRYLAGGILNSEELFKIYTPGSIPRVETAPPKRTPSASYVNARKKVEEYLCKVPVQTFDDIIGNESELAQLKDAIRAPVEHKELYEKYGMKMPKGALLSGPPGCGKTMFARAAASEMAKLYGEDEFEFLSLAGSELQSGYVGETEKTIMALFNFAREYKAYHGYPLLIFMDECEVILPDRTGRVRRLAPWEESQVATFIAQLDGMEECGAFLLMATNRPEVIDQAVLRDGRCDFKITIKRPTTEAIEVIIRKNFEHCFIKDPIEDLVFAAVEGLFDPHKVLVEFRALGYDLAEHQVKNLNQKHFCLEHIVSGAMAASIPSRATRHAFARDKAAGTVEGIVTADVIAAVNDLYNENKQLEHSFAFEEFRSTFERETREQNMSRGNGSIH